MIPPPYHNHFNGLAESIIQSVEFILLENFCQVSKHHRKGSYPETHHQVLGIAVYRPCRDLPHHISCCPAKEAVGRSSAVALEPQLTDSVNWVIVFSCPSEFQNTLEIYKYALAIKIDVPTGWLNTDDRLEILIY
ncbi:MAG TPA: hypothetical protein VIM51_04495 [Desulfosporosinus sp.]